MAEPTNYDVSSIQALEGIEHVLGPIRKLKGIDRPIEASTFYRYDGLEAVQGAEVPFRDLALGDVPRY